MTPLKKIRLERRQSAQSIARALGVDPATISRVERGLARCSPDLAERLAKHFGGAITELQILYPERFTQ